jgi:pSer/pThr/pTyr-binding forkhead associated (FHA) protein|tara:strand:- start:168 stop:332 length:165 start_codon:yes stop_codon:yes gene_type:complete
MNKITIGKTPNNDILISDNIHIYISDFNSLNSTYVNGLRVQDAILNNLDILKQE